MHPRGNRFLLFLISSKGVPKHWTTSVNKGDTEDVYNWAHILRRNWCYQLSFPRVILATIFFNTIFRFTNFLSFVSAAWRSARNSCSQGQCKEKWIAYFVYGLQSSLVGRISRLAQIEPSKLPLEQVVLVYERHDRIVDEKDDLVLYLRVLWRKALERPANLCSAKCHAYFAAVYGCISMLQSWRSPQKPQVAQSSTSCSPQYACHRTSNSTEIVL